MAAAKAWHHVPHEEDEDIEEQKKTYFDVHTCIYFGKLQWYQVITVSLQ